MVDFINHKHKYLSKHSATIMPAVTAYTALWKRAISRARFSPSIFSRLLSRVVPSWSLRLASHLYLLPYLSSRPSFSFCLGSPAASGPSSSAKTPKRNRNNPGRRDGKKFHPGFIVATIATLQRGEREIGQPVPEARWRPRER